MAVETAYQPDDLRKVSQAGRAAARPSCGSAVSDRSSTELFSREYTRRLVLELRFAQDQSINARHDPRARATSESDQRI